MANVLVTGGGGFIGTWVLRELIAQGHRPVVYDQKINSARLQRLIPDRTALQIVQGDLTDTDRLKYMCDAESISHIIHLAALLTPDCQNDPLHGCRVNVLGTTEVFDLARCNADRIRRVSWASSLAVFGPATEPVSATQISGGTSPPSFYGAFKRSSELIAEQYARHFGVSSLGIRPHVVYGPERTDGLTAAPSLAARAVAAGDEYQIDYSGVCGYDYVEDVARAFVRAAFEGPDGAHAVELDGPQATTTEIAACLNELAPDGRELITSGGPEIPSNAPGESTSISRIYSDWQPTSLRDGLQQTVEFYRSPQAG